MLIQRDSNTTDLDGPAIDPPAGITPDLEHPGGSQALGYFVCLFCSIVSTLAVLTRLGSRLILKRFRIEDLFLVLGLVSKPVSSSTHMADLTTT